MLARRGWKTLAATSSAIAHLDSETASAIAAFKVDLIRWFLGSTIAMTAVLLAAIRLLPR